MEKLLWAVTGVMIAVALGTASMVASHHFSIEQSSHACPGAHGMPALCLDLWGQTYAITFNPESSEGQDASDLLVGILSASAAILAISFTLNQVILSNVSQRYSSRIVESHAEAPTKAFGAFVFMVLGSAALLLVHDYLPAWSAAGTVLIPTLGLFVALWFFTRGFIHMKRIMSPHSFIEDARRSILEDMTGSRGESKRVQSLRERQSRGTIKSLGDTAIKSMASNDADVCSVCIDALYDVGKTFLYKKSNSPTDYKIVDDPRRDLLCNMHANYVLEEFARILKESTSSKNAAITHDVLAKSFMMTALTMKDANNESIIRVLYDTRDYKGSFFLQLIEQLHEVGRDSEKNFAIRHLADLATTQDSHIPFVEQFVTYHVFRSVMTIIDKDDFDLFKEVIRVFSYHYFFKRMETERESIKNSIRRHSYHLDSDARARYDKIAFELDNYAKKDFGKMLEIKDATADMVARIGSDSSADATQNEDSELPRGLDRLYIYSLLWGTFFRIACYIVGKGDKYGRYLHELWYHTNPYGQPVRSVNTTPVSKDVDWNSLYAVWQGHGGNTWISPLDDARRYEPYCYEYAVLHMLREDKIWSVPTEADIDEWGRGGHEYALEYHHEAVEEMDVEPFLKALDSLAESNMPAEILPDLDIRARTLSVRKKLKAFRDDQTNIRDKLVARMPVDPEKIKEWQDNVRSAYANSTKADAVARIKYDAQLCGSVISASDHHARRALVKTGNMEMDGNLGDCSAEAEFEKILQTIEDNSARVQMDARDPSATLKSCVEKIRDSGHKPSIALMSPDGTSRIWETCPSVMRGDAMDIGGVLLQIVDSRVGGPEVLILDPACVEVTYKSSNKAGRLQLDVQGDGAGTEVTTMTCSICMDVKILDCDGMIRIDSSVPPDRRQASAN